MLNAKNGSLRLGGSDMDYISFGSGGAKLVLLPGLGDGLRTVKGMALPMAATYRLLGRHFRVYMFSRKNRLDAGCTTRDMAADQREAMQRLGITRAHIVGVSHGGMIAQYLAIDYPELVERLVLAVSSPFLNDCLDGVISRWIRLAEEGDFKGIFIDSAELSYTERHLKRLRPVYPFMGKLAKPRNPERFIAQASSCLSHDARGELGKIACPTLVIGGAQDRIATAEGSMQLAAEIAGSELVIYPDLGHGAYDEAADFQSRIIEFCQHTKRA